MPKQPYLPERGDIVWVVLDPRVGHEQSGRQPALVLSPRLVAERTGLAVICPITSRVKGLPFEVVLRECSTEGAVLPLHLRSVDIVVRKAVFIERIPAQLLESAAKMAAALIGRE